MLEACPPIQAQPGIAQQKQPLHILNVSGRDLPVNRPEPSTSDFFQRRRNRATPGVFGRKDMQSNRCSPPTPCLLRATPCIVGVTLWDAAGRSPADQFEEPHHGCRSAAARGSAASLCDFRVYPGEVLPRFPSCFPRSARRWRTDVPPQGGHPMLCFRRRGPTPAGGDSSVPWHTGNGSCRRCRAMRWRPCSAAGAWAWSTRPGNSGSTASSPSRC